MMISSTSRRASVLAAAMTAIALPAFAADLGGGPVRPLDHSPRQNYRPLDIERWTGLYFGGTLGYGFGATDVRGGSGAFDLDANGGVGTVFAGYNWQRERLVLGLEADVGFGSLDDRLGAGLGLVSSDLNVMGSLRARAGYLLTPAFMVYGTAGVAAADFDFRANGITSSETLVGYQVGAGTELAITPNWAMRMEYIYTDFAPESINHAGLTNSYEPDFHTVRAGFSYKF